MKFVIDNMKMLGVGSITIGSTGIVGGGTVVVLLIGVVLSFAFWRKSRGSKVLTDTLLEPLGNARTAKVDINTSTGNLTIDRLIAREEMLASGTLQYLENWGLPTRLLNRSNSQATFTLKAIGKGQSWFRFLWQTCNGATEWQIHLNPSVLLDINISSGGGNVKLNLDGMAITHLSADTGGGNMDVSLPDNAAIMSVMARTGGGNVTVEIGHGITGNNFINAHSGVGNVVVRLPSGIAACIHATSGMGKVIVNSPFIKIDEKTYQSPNYENAADKVEIMLHSGAGKVIVNTK